MTPAPAVIHNLFKKLFHSRTTLLPAAPNRKADMANRSSAREAASKEMPKIPINKSIFSPGTVDG
jgi:hypothetical protein